MTKRADVYEIVTERILAALDAGTVPWRKPWHAADGMPANLTSKKEYRGINPLLLALSPFESRWWLTYKQAQKLGGQVRKGEASSIVTFWKWLEREDDDNPGKLVRIPLLRYYRVFNSDQVDGIADKIPAVERPKGGFVRRDAAEAVFAGYVKRSGVQIEHGGPRACYSPLRDIIRLPDRQDFTSAGGYYSTAFHEAAHSTGHASRLDRFSDDYGDLFSRSHTYAAEELVAEMGASFLLAHTGLDCPEQTDQNAAYIDGWRRKISKEPRLIVTSAARGQKAADLILNRKFEKGVQS